MKANNILAIFACASLALVGCQEDDILNGGKYGSAQPGEEINFGGMLQYNTNRVGTTRTVYGNKGDDGTEIKWYEGDMVRIYCEQATLGEEGESELKYCDYTVNDYISATESPSDDTYEQTHSTGLTPTGESGLFWGTGEHQFYGVYPSPQMLNKYDDDAVAASALTITNDKITAYLPNLQRPGRFVDPTAFGDNDEYKHYTIHPSMRYAYMVANQTVTSPSNGVDLTFYPIVTAVEMTLENTGTFAIEGVSLVSISSENVICGDFTTTISTRTIQNTSTDASYKAITIPVAAEGSTIDLNPGDKITFTAFMTLDADLASIGVTLVYANGVATKKATLKSSDDNVKIIQAQKKNFIANIGVNFSQAVGGVDLEEWMGSISTTDGITTSLLSIPAAGGAASGHTDDWETYETYLEQELTIGELWSQGIRCFEFTVDINDGDNLGDSYVYCNSKPSTLTLSEAVDMVKDNLLEHPSEFAMVIITYQQNAGWDLRSQADNSGGGVTYNRDPATFMTQLNTFWNEVSSTANDNWPSKTEVTIDGQITITTGTACYSPSMTLENARGKLFCIARPTSEYEDNYVTLTKGDANRLEGVSNASTPSYTISNANIVVIEGWGALKDKWEQRGYTACTFLRGSGNNEWEEVPDEKEWYNTVAKSLLGYDNKPGRPFDVSSTENDTKNTITSSYVDDNLTDLTTDFSYTVKTSAGTAAFDAWAQEWMRVSDLESPFYLTFSIDGTSYTKDFFWANSTNEKIANVQETFDKALADQTGNTLYINSLCGYFIDSDIEYSYLPNSLTDMSGYWNIAAFYYRGLSGASQYAGMAGNISRFAQWINNSFYNYLLTKDLGGKSTGIIMMDRVSDDATTNPAGYYIPRIILANNPFEQTTPSALSLRRDNYEDGDVAAAPQRREASESKSDEISIVWE